MNRQVQLHWTAVGRDSFDVSLELRIQVRASAHPVAA